MHGPFYHGTDKTGRELIDQHGFEIIDPTDPRKNMDTKPLVPTWLPDEASSVLMVKWKKGGTDYNVLDLSVEPV